MSKSSAGTEGFDLGAFLEQNRRNLAIGAAAVVVAGAGAWLWSSSANLKDTRAAQALSQAERSFFSGNLPLAETELQRVVQRYASTPSGVRAKMMLAQAMYGQGRHDQGVALLQEIVGSGAAKPYRAAIQALIAAGYEDLGRLDAAAAAYATASTDATTRMESDAYKADQARVLMGAGKADAALVIWQELAADESSSMASEARLRVGELATKPASRS